jgi:hypothetical protein
MSVSEHLKLEWMKLPSGDILGGFHDALGNGCSIGRAKFHADKRSIYLTAGHGTLVLTPEMCAELALVLGYIAYTDGQLPETD